MSSKGTKVIYHGERVGLTGKICQLFKDKNGKEFLFQGVKGVWLGNCYEVSKDDQIKARPEAIDNNGFELTEDDRRQAEVAKLSCVAERLSRRKAMDFKRPHVDIITAIRLLSPFYRSVGRFDQDRFVRYLENEMSKKPRKKKR